jgi:hypothetical protein
MSTTIHLLLAICRSKVLRDRKDLLEFIDYLTDRGLKVKNDTDSDGWSALMHICNSDNPNRLEIAEYMIYNGMNINIKNEDEVDALLIAIKKGSLDLIKLLLDNHVNIDSVVLHECNIDAWNCCPLSVEEVWDLELYDKVCRLLYPNCDQPGNLIDWRSAFALDFEQYDGPEYGAIYNGCDHIPSEYRDYLELPYMNYDDWYLYKTWKGTHTNIYHWKTNINPTDNAILIETDEDTGKLVVQTGDEMFVGGCVGCHPVVYTKNISWGSSHGESSFNCRSKDGEVNLEVVMSTLYEYLYRHCR